jgi:hypothetical protein
VQAWLNGAVDRAKTLNDASLFRLHREPAREGKVQQQQTSDHHGDGFCTER